MNTVEAYRRGFTSGKRAGSGLKQSVEASLQGWKAGTPALAQVDLAQEFLTLDRQRLDAVPSYTKFPELRGWPDLILAERNGFRDATGCGDLELAFHFTRWFYMCCRLNTRYVGTAVGTANCTAVFIRDSKEGGPLYGRNWDVQNVPGLDLHPPRRGPDGKRRLWSKGVSCATLCDDEPTEIFPINAWQVIPEDCRRIPDVVAFLDRYVDFWSPCNGIIVDEELNSVAYEKANAKVGWRYSNNGTAAVTACARIIPSMKAHQDRCHRKSLAVRNYDESSPDWKYWTGAEARYHRLLKLVDEAAARGPTLEDMGNIVTDHAVPYPARVCISGDSCHPDLDPKGAEWTMRSRAAVLEGPNRRTLFWRVEGDQPCYANPPFLVPGEGVVVQPHWRKGTRPILPAVGPDDEMEAYRQYEFDYPNHYPL